MKRHKALIICPRCEKEKGKKIALAERLPSGILAIKRAYNNGQYQMTLITGKDLKIACGECASVAYSKEL